jgi:SAM-dependent methyltransferase
MSVPGRRKRRLARRVGKLKWLLWRARQPGAARRVLIRLKTRPSARHAEVGSGDLWVVTRRFQFDFLLARGLRPEHRLLDIGCGTLRGGIPLIDYLQAEHYIGIEARGQILIEARKELAEAGLEHKRPLLIHASEPEELKLEVPVDYVWAFEVLIHLTDELLDGYFDLAARSLAEHGKFYANVNFGERVNRKWKEFPWVWRPRDFYVSTAARRGLAMEDVGTVGELGHRTGGFKQEEQMMVCFTRAPGGGGPVKGAAALRGGV